MRIKLTLAPLERRSFIPFNYQHPLSAAIYKILSTANQQYAEFLHQKGYLTVDGKPLKLFTFSYLFIPRVKVVKNMLGIFNFSAVTLQISSPLIDDFIQNLVIGLFENQELAIGNRYTVGRFTIQAVESLPTPEFAPLTKFTCLSPFVASTMKEHDGRLQPYYFRPDDPELGEALRQSLLRKYETIYHHLPQHDRLALVLDADYVARKGGTHKVTKLITLKEHAAGEATQIKAIYCPFTLSGSTELMQVAWDAEIGGRCSQGFGCVAVVD
ncbi:CRISPR-associated endoribonuclease Cas6 [candidate division KSB1 bacterium]|nr:CRISPR-associated endoribonuclease Cas6 [candidate division KSB1 bacterium]